MHMRIGARALRAASLAVLVLAFSRAGAAQNVGTIAGTVKDAQGLAVPGATVSLENRLSQVSQDTITDESGRYTLATTASGTYVLGVSLEGFTPAQQVVEVRSSVALNRDVELKVGSLA